MSILSVLKSTRILLFALTNIYTTFNLKTEFGCGEWEVYRTCAPPEVGKADGCLDITEENVNKTGCRPN